MYTLLRGVIRKILFGSTIRAVVGSNMVRRGPATSVTTRSMGGLRSYYIYTWDQIRRKEPLLHGVYIEDQEPQGPSVEGQAPRTMEEPLTKSRGPRAISRAKQNDFAQQVFAMHRHLCNIFPFTASGTKIKALCLSQNLCIERGSCELLLPLLFCDWRHSR